MHADASPQLDLGAAELDCPAYGLSIHHGSPVYPISSGTVNRLSGTTWVPGSGMVKPMKTLGQLVKEKREARDWTQPQLGQRLGISQQSVSTLEKDELIRTPSYILELIDVLEINPDELRGIRNLPSALESVVTSRVKQSLTKTESNVGDFVTEPPNPRQFPEDVPVWGTAVGGDDGEFHFNGGTIEHVRRPPGVAGVVGLFAVYIQGESMSPRFEPGELVYVHPGRPPKNGDDVLIELHAREGEVGGCFIKRLRARTPTKVIVQQFNPPDETIEFQLDHIKKLYRIVPWSELLGL